MTFASGALIAVLLTAGQAPEGVPSRETPFPKDGRTDTPEWEAIRRRIAEDRVKVDFLRKEESSILQGLQALDRSLAEKKAKAKALGEDVKHLETTIGILEEHYAKAEGELGEVREAAGRRAAAMHRLRRTRLTELFREVHAPIELRRLRERLRLVLGYDASLVDKARLATDSSRTILELMKEKKVDLGVARESLAKEVEEAALLREERAALLQAIRHEKRASERLTAELTSAAKRLEKELGVVRGAGPQPEAVPGGFDAQVAKLPWPVMGKVEVTFGKKVDPASDMVMVQKGIDIRAPIAEPVRAVFAGTVAYADWFEGFGRLVIVEHEGGYYTLYAHLESFEVQRGARIAQYQVIGSVGDSGSAKGAYLYFEIRRGRDAVDPLRWLAP